MIKKNILTLIPDKHYYETYRNKISENFSSFVENYSTQDVLDMVSTALNTLGFVACCVPEPMMTKVVGATLSFSGCVVGLIAPMFNYNDLKNTIVRLPLGGGYVTLYIV